MANVEKTVPRNFITPDGFGITGPCRRYLEPLIGGEDYPPYENGLPEYAKLSKMLQDDAAYIPLYYGVGAFLFKPYVKNAGTNNFFDHYWNEMSILQH